MSISRVGKHYKLTISIKNIFKLIGFILFVVFLLLSFDKLKEAKYFPIKKVKIIGARHIDHPALQTLLMPMVNKNFFAIDVDKIKETLLQLPWVADVLVRREWPDQVFIQIAEKNPIALWNETSLLSANGELFIPTDGAYPNDLPALKGPLGQQMLMLNYQKKISRALLPLQVKIVRLELTDEMTWNITLDNGIKLALGHKDILTRLNHFVKVYPKIIGDRWAEIDYVDLRYPNGLSVRWKSNTNV